MHYGQGRLKSSIEMYFSAIACHAIFLPFCSALRPTSLSLGFVFPFSLYLWLSLSLPQAFHCCVAQRQWFLKYRLSRKWYEGLFHVSFIPQVVAENVQVSSPRDLSLNLGSLPPYRKSNAFGPEASVVFLAAFCSLNPLSLQI